RIEPTPTAVQMDGVPNVRGHPEGHGYVDAHEEVHANVPAGQRPRCEEGIASSTRVPHEDDRPAQTPLLLVGQQVPTNPAVADAAQVLGPQPGLAQSVAHGAEPSTEDYSVPPQEIDPAARALWGGIRSPCGSPPQAHAEAERPSQCTAAHGSPPRHAAPA